MLVSINAVTMIYVLFIILEEFIYYFWNRYVYGPKEKRPRIWKNRFAIGIAFLMRLRSKESRQKETQKLSS
jgi:hypothetical protein